MTPRLNPQTIKPVWILFSRRWGGPDQVAIADMVELANADIPIHLICVEGSPVHAAALRHPRLKVIPVINPPRHRFDWAFVRWLRQTLAQVGANIVHINNDRSLWYVEWALIGRRDIAILANRHVPFEPGFKNFLRGILLRRLDYMLVLSESVRRSVLARTALSERQVKVIHLGLDFSRFDPARHSGVTIRQEWGADKDTILIGSVGRLVEEVGQETFLKAAAGLMKYTDWKMRFVIVGEEPLVTSPEYVARLQELVRLFHMEDHVKFAALGDNLPEVMSAFDIFVMPGREEVPGLGALEALAMERPVVLSNVVGTQEIVGNEDYGLLVRAEDAYDLQAKILTLLQNPSRRLGMGTQGRQHVLKQFDKKTRFLKTLSLYERCLKRRQIRARHA